MSEDTVVDSDKYLYGIVLTDSGLPSGADGVQAGQLHTVSSGRVAAVVSDLVEPDILGTPDDLRAHIEVLDGIATTQPILPLAFGTVVPGDTDIAGEVLAPREAEYTEALEKLSGHAQFTLLARYDRDTVLGEIILDNPEAAELRGRIVGTSEDETRTERIRLGEIIVKTMESWKSSEAPPLLEQLAPLTADMSERESGQAEDVTEVAVLLRHDAIPKFNDLVDEMAEAHQERLRFRLVGPQAPYDFVPEI
ncbi:GvpL/GvpF family gas vesicle protein [Brevibacterium sp. UCMA 11752]|uniref:GvpL/GvpF family gas vesicle protein n=1 Tax=Brevibacterium sp. UCMA 11752 TaxID=2745946 RepID=UPI001F25DD07|nr:GvpL/GvpF family gas vesicle protein [Brevibacterium sp. UCMA 11752]MCF2587244.1 GvpL/GvpF family gas vesicle protein [Brevibacterium sp. UCMA 11752]